MMWQENLIFYQPLARQTGQNIFPWIDLSISLCPKETSSKKNDYTRPLQISKHLKITCFSVAQFLVSGGKYFQFPLLHIYVMPYLKSWFWKRFLPNVVEWPHSISLVNDIFTKNRFAWFNGCKMHLLVIYLQYSCQAFLHSCYATMFHFYVYNLQSARADTYTFVRNFSAHKHMCPKPLSFMNYTPTTTTGLRHSQQYLWTVRPAAGGGRADAVTGSH